MAYLNQVQLIGNLGKTPELRYMSNDDPVVNVGLATTKKFKDRDQAAKEHTEWHNLVVYGPLAEIFAKYLQRGSEIFVSGELRTRKWVDSQDITRYMVEIVVDNMQMLGGRRNEQQNDRGAPGPNTRTSMQDMPDDALPPAAGDDYSAEPALEVAAPVDSGTRKGNTNRKPRSK